VGDVVLPSRDDPLVAGGSEGIGGPAGRRVRMTDAFRRALVAVLVMTAVVCGAALLEKQPCRATAWTTTDIYPKLCYSDIAFLYRLRGDLAEGRSPYASTSGQEPLEYPVLTGGRRG
jgi:hypothetical protein